MIEPLPDDEWSDHVENGEAFAAEIAVIAIGGMSPLSQLFNPAASGVRIRLRCVESFAFLAGSINQNIRRHDVALPSGPSVFGGPQNLLGGGALPVAEFRFDNVVALVGSPFHLILAAGSNRRGYPVDHLDWGHDLEESEGLMHNGTVGGFLILGYQWAEVPL